MMVRGVRKEQLREKYKAQRKLLTPEQIDDFSIKIANKSLALDIWQLEYYHLFLPIEKHKEINTTYLLQILQGRDKQIVLSSSDFESKTMSHLLLTDNTRITVNAMGIPEPQNGLPVSSETIDVVFIPLLAYDTRGNRIGYGQGFYDRFLGQCRRDIIKVGLSFFEPEEILIDSEKFDIPLDYCLTPITEHSF